MNTPPPLLGVAVLCPLFLCACAADPSQGYSFASTFPQGVNSIHIPVFDNQTFYPGLEAQLTEAVIKQAQATGMKVVRSDAADSRLNAVVKDAKLRRLTLEKTTGLVQEEAFQLTIDFEWQNLRTGKTILARKNFSTTDTFVPARPTGERIDVGQQGAVQRMARDIVAEMRSSW